MAFALNAAVLLAVLGHCAQGDDYSSREDGRGRRRRQYEPSTIDGFVGPFVGMGITGWNDLAMSEVSDPGVCAQKCLQISNCRSFDYGARNTDMSRVKGECWLSTANRDMVGRAYTKWRLYDYYERIVPTIAEAVRGNEDMTVLAAALVKANLGERLDDPGPFTLFAPTDAAFAALGVTREDLLARPDLANVLKLHLSLGRLWSSMLEDGSRVQTVQGASLPVNLASASIAIGSATVIGKDVECRNGLIHIIDAVFELPPVVPDESIMKVLSGAGFTFMRAAIERAGLLETLDASDEYTVFAATDAAFTALAVPMGLTTDKLLDDPDVVGIVKTHIVPGRVSGADIADGEVLGTLQGVSLTFHVESETVMVKTNSSFAIVGPFDLNCTNGIVHGVDRVLLPPDAESKFAIADPGAGTQFASPGLRGAEASDAGGSGDAADAGDSGDSGNSNSVLIPLLVGIACALQIALIACVVFKLRGKKKENPVSSADQYGNNVVVGQPVAQTDAPVEVKASNGEVPKSAEVVGGA